MKHRLPTSGYVAYIVRVAHTTLRVAEQIWQHEEHHRTRIFGGSTVNVFSKDRRHLSMLSDCALNTLLPQVRGIPVSQMK